jgi:hypothetical protein
VIEPGTRVTRNERAVHRELASGGGVLLHLDTAAYHGVNEIGALIWSLLDGDPVADVARRLEKELRETPPSLVDDVQEFVEALAERDLVRVETSP